MLMKDYEINCPVCYEAGKAAEPKARKLDTEMKENAKQMRGVNWVWIKNGCVAYMDG